MSHPSASTETAASTEPVSAGPESPPADVSGRGDEEHRDTAARAMALIAGLLVGTVIGVGIGVGVGNAVRKRFDRWAPSYLCAARSRSWGRTSLPIISMAAVGSSDITWIETMSAPTSVTSGW
jgi:hypothetical protein